MGQAEGEGRKLSERGLRETVTIGPKCLWANGRPRSTKMPPEYRVLGLQDSLS